MNTILNIYGAMFFWAVVPVLSLDLLAFFISGRKYNKGLHRIVSFIRPLGVISLMVFAKPFLNSIQKYYGDNLPIGAGIVIFGGFGIIVMAYIICDIFERKMKL